MALGLFNFIGSRANRPANIIINKASRRNGLVEREDMRKYEWAQTARRICRAGHEIVSSNCPPLESWLIAGARDSPVAAANDKNVFKMARSPPAPSASTELKLGQYTHRKVVPIMANMSDV